MHADPGTSLCEDQVTSCQMSHGSWPQADMVLQLGHSISQGKKLWAAPAQTIAHRDGYLFESDNSTDGLPICSETRHGAT